MLDVYIITEFNSKITLCDLSCVTQLVHTLIWLISQYFVQKNFTLSMPPSKSNTLEGCRYRNKGCLRSLYSANPPGTVSPCLIAKVL
jgi:hypothetical protein